MIKKMKFWTFLAIVIVVLGAIFFLGSRPKTKQIFLPSRAECPVQSTQETKSTDAPKTTDVATFETKVPISSTQLPLPTEEFVEEITDCSLVVRCDDILKNIEKLTDGKGKYIPQDGMIYSNQHVEFEIGESVFDVLYRETRNNKIHMEFVNTPMYDSAYIEGIANIYEFDCGDTSGWTYTVNGESPKYGCSQYIIQKGDKIEFVYKCKLY